MEWQRSVDVLVMGSGGAGQCAAVRAHDLGLDVLIVEKGETWGGSTAMSAGAVWLPNNRAMKELGLPLTITDATRPLEQHTGFMPMRWRGEESSACAWLSEAHAGGSLDCSSLKASCWR